MTTLWNHVKCPKLVCGFLPPELFACLHFYVFWGQSLTSALSWLTPPDLPSLLICCHQQCDLGHTHGFRCKETWHDVVKGQRFHVVLQHVNGSEGLECQMGWKSGRLVP